MNTLYPGLVGTFFIFLFGTFGCLIWLVHRSHMVPTFLFIQSSCILLLALGNAHQYFQ